MKEKKFSEFFKECVSTSPYKPKSKRYYEDALWVIKAICIDYDGYRKAKDLMALIDDIKETASKAIRGEALYVRLRNCKPRKDDKLVTVNFNTKK
jgi:hypothetical protein